MAIRCSGQNRPVAVRSRLGAMFYVVTYEYISIHLHALQTMQSPAIEAALYSTRSFSNTVLKRCPSDNCSALEVLLAIYSANQII